MLILERKDDKVYYNGVELKINKQSTKGPGHEAVYIADCPEAMGQKWVSLKRLNDGINEIECKAREVSSNNKYRLTDDEKAEIDELQSRIDEIINNAKQRYVKVPNLNVNVDKLSHEEKLEHIETVQKYLDSLRA